MISFSGVRSPRADAKLELRTISFAIVGCDFLTGGDGF